MEVDQDADIAEGMDDGGSSDDSSSGDEEELELEKQVAELEKTVSLLFDATIGRTESLLLNKTICLVKIYALSWEQVYGALFLNKAHHQ